MRRVGRGPRCLPWAATGPAAVLALVLSLGSGALAQASVDSWCVAVWYPSSEHPGGADAILANSDVIDVVHPFWFTPDATGALLDQSGDRAVEQVEQWRSAGMLVLPSIFAGHWRYLSDELRPAHVAAIVQLVEARGFDGIDIDYEMFALETRDVFSTFVEELSAALHANGRLLAVTVHAKTLDQSPFPSAAAQDWVRLAAAADIFNLMTYDYTSRGEPPGPVASIPWAAEVVEYALTTTTADEIRVGLPFYGYSWRRGRPPATATTWEAADRMVTQFGLETVRDPLGHELAIELDVTGLPRQQVYVSDAATTAARLAALPATGGVAIWGIGGEDPAHWQVLRDQRPAPCALRTRER